MGAVAAVSEDSTKKKSVLFQLDKDIYEESQKLAYGERSVFLRNALEAYLEESDPEVRALMRDKRKLKAAARMLSQALDFGR